MTSCLAFSVRSSWSRGERLGEEMKFSLGFCLTFCSGVGRERRGGGAGGARGGGGTSVARFVSLLFTFLCDGGGREGAGVALI